eukprot:CAMPEP_0204515156 /NCGR_PEP_ID=MMETSP0661-20131031/2468_1 /ASSEMBLY_ACC=CAM_ASM_000606 /TAXON_ID=109239 /ORGANISM="Alexandrium margalefi, Strain AMGDE01CS-322" /LENGTH=153 /DNA_ID=CAMNT_0051520455 /DNA_START=313 /DNA_END=771 /DNA_ORIENTATION=+
MRASGGIAVCVQCRVRLASTCTRAGGGAHKQARPRGPGDALAGSWPVPSRRLYIVGCWSTPVLLAGKQVDARTQASVPARDAAAASERAVAAEEAKAVPAARAAVVSRAELPEVGEQLSVAVGSAGLQQHALRSAAAKRRAASPAAAPARGAA